MMEQPHFAYWLLHKKLHYVQIFARKGGLVVVWFHNYHMGSYLMKNQDEKEGE